MDQDRFLLLPLLLTLTSTVWGTNLYPLRCEEKLSVLESDFNWRAELPLESVIYLAIVRDVDHAAREANLFHAWSGDLPKDAQKLVRNLILVLPALDVFDERPGASSASPGRPGKDQAVAFDTLALALDKGYIARFDRRGNIAANEDYAVARLTATDRHQFGQYLQAISLVGRNRFRLMFRLHGFNFAERPTTNSFRANQAAKDVLRVLAAIIEDSNTQLTSGELARRAGLSRANLYRKFAEAFDLPVGKYRNLLMAIEARRLMSECEMSCSQVAARLGFTDPNAFGPFYKRMLGRNPSKDRR